MAEDLLLSAAAAVYRPRTASTIQKVHCLGVVAELLALHARLQAAAVTSELFECKCLRDQSMVGTEVKLQRQWSKRNNNNNMMQSTCVEHFPSSSKGVRIFTAAKLPYQFTKQLHLLYAMVYSSTVSCILPSQLGTLSMGQSRTDRHINFRKTDLVAQVPRKMCTW